MMTIGEASKLSGVSIKAIRHYEAIGVIANVARTKNRYRSYSENDVKILSFVKRSRNLGFSMKEIKKLIELWKDETRSSQEVKEIISKHIQEMEKEITNLQNIVGTLQQISSRPTNENDTSSTILDGLAEHKTS